jgi:hypothetical protein
VSVPDPQPVDLVTEAVEERALRFTGSARAYAMTEIERYTALWQVHGRKDERIRDTVRRILGTGVPSFTGATGL